MINAQQLVGEIRRALDPVDQEIRRDPYLAALETGTTLYGSEAEVAAGFLVNFAAWGANCARMSRARGACERSAQERPFLPRTRRRSSGGISSS